MSIDAIILHEEGARDQKKKTDDEEEQVFGFDHFMMNSTVRCINLHKTSSNWFNDPFSFERFIVSRPWDQQSWKSLSSINARLGQKSHQNSEIIWRWQKLRPRRHIEHCTNLQPNDLSRCFVLRFSHSRNMKISRWWSRFFVFSEKTLE